MPVEIDEFSLSDFARVGFAPHTRAMYLQHHVPQAFHTPYHFHPSLEVNFLQECDMTYSFSGEEVHVERNRFCVFWGGRPHRAIAVTGPGRITNAYISLSQFLRWGLPNEFVNLILAGAVLSAKEEQAGDASIAERWAKETDQTNQEWQQVHALELQSRLARMAVEGSDVIFKPSIALNQKMIGGTAVGQFEKMLRFVAENYTESIAIKDVAKAGGVSPNYAISLFSKMLGRTIKNHITDMRVFHAKMQLSETNTKILTIAMDCGFGSLSAFYRTFQINTGQSPAQFRRGMVNVQNVKDEHTLK